MTDDDKGTAPKPVAEPPLKNPKVDVTVTPKETNDRGQSMENRKYSHRVEESLEKEIKKQLDDNKGGGAKKQLDAAEKAADGAKKGADPKKIVKIKIKVGGEVDGDKVSREKTVTPKEGA